MGNNERASKISAKKQKKDLEKIRVEEKSKRLDRFIKISKDRQAKIEKRAKEKEARIENAKYSNSIKVSIRYDLIGYNINDFEIVGIKDGDSETTLIVWVKCKSCGNVREYKLEQGKSRRLKCDGCKTRAVLVPKIIIHSNFVEKSFFMLPVSLYRKLYARTIESETQFNDLLKEIEKIVHFK